MPNLIEQQPRIIAEVDSIEARTALSQLQTAIAEHPGALLFATHMAIGPAQADASQAINNVIRSKVDRTGEFFDEATCDAIDANQAHKEWLRQLRLSDQSHSSRKSETSGQITDTIRRHRIGIYIQRCMVWQEQQHPASSLPAAG